MNTLLLNDNLAVNIEDQDDFIDKLISGWEFYLPDHKLAERILKLNDQIGDEYFRERYWNLQNNNDEDLDLKNVERDQEINENFNNPVWHKDIFNQIKSILFHDEESPDYSHKEDVTLFRKYISERMYNHLAMLSRSPHAKKGGAFSIWDDVALEISGKIGLGLYFSDQISGDDRAEIEGVLKELAENFEEWLIDKKVGRFSATFAVVVSIERSNESSPGNKLILVNDVRNKRVLTA